MENRKRPLSLNLIGWFYIACALFILINRVNKYSKLLFSQNTLQTVDTSNISFVNLAQVIIPIFIIIISIQFLKFRKWAKNVIEILSWLSLFWFGIFWSVFSLVLKYALPSAKKAMQGHNWFYPLVIFMSVTGFLVSVITFILIIKTLRNKDIRELFKNRQ